jgi:hypothetical protein
MKPDQNENVCLDMIAFVTRAAAGWNDNPKALTIAAAAALLAACATSPEPAGIAPTVRHYPAPDIIVGTRNSGRFETTEGCIYFRFENRPDRRAPALFASGARLSSDRRFILLPGGASIPFGRRVTIAFEAPPNATGLDSQCGANPILVLNLVVTEQ